jgi:hypothetical protein
MFHSVTWWDDRSEILLVEIDNILLVIARKEDHIGWEGLPIVKMDILSEVSFNCEADHSPPASADVKITFVYTSTPPYIFMA